MPRRALFAAPLLFVIAAFAQRFGFQGHDEAPRPAFPAAGEFHFVRLEYTDLPEFHRRWGFASRGANGEGWWIVDWPDAEDHFSLGVQRLTRIETGAPLHLRLEDTKLFDNPWIYATQAGWWGLTDAETARLREYLLRGGFLVVDDFWGPQQWEIFQSTMERVLPHQPIPDIAETDSAMHVLYDIQEKDRSFIPALAIRAAVRSGRWWSNSRKGPRPPGAPCTTDETEWWSRPTSTPISATPGSTPIRRNTQNT